MQNTGFKECNLMKNLIALIISGALVISSYGQTRSVLVGTNGAVVAPTNFWSANASNATAGIGLGTAATNPASAFQPSSTVLSNLASSNGVNLTNIPVAGVVGALATNGSATNLVNFPASLLTTNGNGGGLTNLTAANITGTVGLASNVTGTIAISNGGTGATNAAGARTNLGLGSISSNSFNITNSAIYTLTNFVVTNGVAFFGGGGSYFATFGSTNTGFAGFIGGVGYFHNGSNIWYVDTNGLEFNSPSVVRSNLGLPLAALTNTNASNFRTAIGATTIGHSLFTATNSAAAINAIGLSTNFSDQVLSVSNITIGSFTVGSGRGFVVPTSGQTLQVVGTNVSTGVPAFFGWNGFSGAAFSAAEARTNLGLNAWTTNTNSPVFVGTNGEVVSPTNFWQVSPANTRVQLVQPVVNATNAATNARNLFLYSLAISTTGVTNTIQLPTNGTFLGDVATVIHEGPTNSITAVRQIGSGTNIVTLNQFQEAVKFIYEAGGWRLADNLSFVEPIYFSGTNAAANAAVSVSNLFTPNAPLVYNTNGIINYTNTNVLSFTKGIKIKGQDTTNVPTLYWETSDNIGNGSLFSVSRAWDTNSWSSPTNAHTNWSILFLGQNIAPNATGNNVGHPVQSMGSSYLTFENNYNYDGIPNNPASETYFVTRDTNNVLVRTLEILGSQTNAALGVANYNYPLNIVPAAGTVGVQDGLWATAPLRVVYSHPSIGGMPHVFVHNPDTNNSRDVRLNMKLGNDSEMILSLEKAKYFLFRGNYGYAFIATTNGIVVGSSGDLAPAERVHLAGNTRIDGAISFNNTTNAATTVTNLGLGATNNVSFSNITASGTLTATGTVTATTNLVVNGFVDFSTNHTNSNPATNNQINDFIEIRVGTNQFWLPVYK
jgi:hypothetical protein